MTTTDPWHAMLQTLLGEQMPLPAWPAARRWAHTAPPADGRDTGCPRAASYDKARWRWRSWASTGRGGCGRDTAQPP